MRNIYRVFPLFVAFGFILFVSGDVQGQDVINTILKRMDDHNKSLTSLRANVEMVKFNSQINETDTLNGTVAYLPQRNRDPFVRIDWRNPDESMAIVNKEYIIFRPRLRQAFTGNVDKARRGNPRAGSALQFLNMSRAQLRQNFSVIYLGEATIKGGVRTWHLKMTPKSASGYKHAEVWVDSDGMPVQTKIVESNDDTTTILLSGIRKNVTINGSEFKINLPRGTKIVKA
ncbi:MAG TPA: outer-membrane lipoprotein carrier protein LolA [Pyrinomonadaceae bacterium]|nr:outer-membrane lipoprotein carrier protein LolA [Pyrinomonadaceae bacterium]HMP65076.1 outer-membrane lipoprotein carrier protein LolA [Pyrinomonadaceae bacterium]